MFVENNGGEQWNDDNGERTYRMLKSITKSIRKSLSLGDEGVRERGLKKFVNLASDAVSQQVFNCALTSFAKCSDTSTLIKPKSSKPMNCSVMITLQVVNESSVNGGNPNIVRNGDVA